jgi:AcrR family transcriptional regulator
MGRREEKKLQTRQRLRVAAYALFERHGYEASKVEDVARSAGVSPRTVYRYFPTKADLVFSGAPDIERLGELIAARPPEEPPYAAMSAALIEFGPELDNEMTVDQTRIVAADPTLYRYSLEIRDRISDEIGQALVDRGGPGGTEAERRLLGHVAGAALLVAMREWRDAGPERDALAEHMRRVLEAVPRLATMAR